MGIGQHHEFTTWVQRVGEILTDGGHPHGELPPPHERSVPTEGSTRVWFGKNNSIIVVRYVARPDAVDEHLIAGTFYAPKSSSAAGFEEMVRMYAMTDRGAEEAAIEFARFGARGFEAFVDPNAT